MLSSSFKKKKKKKWITSRRLEFTISDDQNDQNDHDPDHDASQESQQDDENQAHNHGDDQPTAGGDTSRQQHSSSAILPGSLTIAVMHAVKNNQ